MYFPNFLSVYLCITFITSKHKYYIMLLTHATTQHVNRLLVRKGAPDI